MGGAKNNRKLNSSHYIDPVWIQWYTKSLDRIADAADSVHGRRLIFGGH